jgi:hypothetical protein
MRESVFVEIQFFVLVVFSLILPISIYAYMMWKKAISRKTVLMFGVLLIVVAGFNVILLQHLSVMAKDSISLIDDSVFASELSVALYLLPLLFGGIGVNVISHILVSHLSDAEKQFDRQHV